MGQTTGFLRDIRINFLLGFWVCLLFLAGTGISHANGLDLSVTKTSVPSYPSSVSNGEVVTHTVEVDVSSTVTTTVYLTDTMPGGMTYSMNPCQENWNCQNFAGGPFTITVPLGQSFQLICEREVPQDSQGSYPLNISGTVNTTAGAVVTNRVEVASDPSDQDPSDNTASSRTRLNGPPSRSIPTINEWGMLILSLSMAALVIFYLRRNRDA